MKYDKNRLKMKIVSFYGSIHFTTTKESKVDFILLVKEVFPDILQKLKKTL